MARGRKRKEEKVKRDDFKRPNGHGTVYKLSGNRRRPWIARVTASWNKDSRQIYETVGYYKTEADALEALDKHRLGFVVPKSDVTFADIYEEWSEGKYQYIGRDTANNYKAAWKYLKQHGSVKISDLRTAHLQSVIDSCHREGLSRSTMEKIRIVAVSLFSYAMENDIVEKNYAEFLRLPKVEKTEQKRFTDLEIKKLTAAAAVNEWVASVLIMIYTGLRISEMLGLTRFNIDIDRQIITGGIKTDAGKNRVVPIHPEIAKHIEHWCNKGGQTLICEGEKGKPLSAKRYREKYYYPALEAAKVRPLTPHACRHTFGSLAAEAGVDTIHIQKLIGHANYAFTADTYTHLELEALRAAMAKI